MKVSNKFYNPPSLHFQVMEISIKYFHFFGTIGFIPGSRMYWFREELKKPAGYNDPASIMDAAAHPNDNDVCTVAGLNAATCLAERKKLVKP